ncbi:MAG: Rrf2 family transcriptional regulator [Bacteroidales bacterium]|nr:Rrf2 family transcriptional regulator [Bacteroidales bacterium]
MFNKETEYALRGLVYIQMQNFKGHRPGTDEIAREIEAPRFFTAKILQRLVRNGFISSLKGKGGGFFFMPGQSEFMLKELIKSIEGDEIFTGCGFGLKHCNLEIPCPLHERYAPIRDAIESLLSTETIQSMAKKYDRGYQLLPIETTL